MHADLAQRAVVDTAAAPWIPRGGVYEKLLEDAGSRRTALVALPAGTALPVFAGGVLDLLVLDGALLEHGPWTYLHEPAGLRALATDHGCTLLVKQRPSQQRARCAVDIRTAVFEGTRRPGVWQAPLYVDADGDIALLRFDPATHVASHHHPQGEEHFVLADEMRDEFGSYGLHAWLRQPAASAHSVDTQTGCLTFSIAHHLRAD